MVLENDATQREGLTCRSVVCLAYVATRNGLGLLGSILASVWLLLLVTRTGAGLPDAK